MNYQKIYNQLIERGHRTLIHGYREKHHIIPKCMGGTDDLENLVELTPEEHYLAHQLLVKIYPDNKKLVFAAYVMTCNNNNGTAARRNKLYGWVKRKTNDARKGRLVSKETRLKQSLSTTGFKHTEESKEKIRAKRALQIMPTGAKRSQESKDRMSAARRGKQPWNKGIPCSDDTKKKISDTLIRKHQWLNHKHQQV